MTKKQRQIVWNKSGGKCWYCGCDLPEKGWHADHFEPVGRVSELVRDARLHSQYTHKFATTGELRYPERDCMENRVPACASCNLMKSSCSIESFRAGLELIKTSIFHHSIARIAKRFGFMVIKDEPVVFWFEKRRILEGSDG